MTRPLRLEGHARTLGRRWDPVHDGRRLFRLAVDALCDPGAPVGPVPLAGLAGDPVLDAGVAVLLALLDPGLAFACAGDASRLTGAIAGLTGAAPAAVPEADFVLCGDRGGRPVAARCRRGTRLTPERGATVVYAGPFAPIPAMLSGPGLAAPRRAGLTLPTAELAALIAANQEPPLGLDAFLVGPEGITALPRSLTVVTGEAVLPGPSGQTGRPGAA